MDLSKLTDEELQALIDGAAPTPAAAPDPLEGTSPVGKLSDRELRLMANMAPAERGAVDQAGHEAGTAARAMVQGGIGGFLGTGALAVDAARNLGYGGMLALSKTGAVAPPDPNKYYGGEDTYFPTTTGVSALGDRAANAMGLPQPENTDERLASAALEGVTGAMTPVGAARSAIKFGPRVVERLSRSTVANPGLQAVAGAAGGVAAQGAVEAGIGTPGTVGAGIIGGVLPSLVHMRGGPRVLATSREGQERIAGDIARRQATDPNAAMTALETARNTRVAGFRHTATAASKDPGIAALDPKLQGLNKVYGEGENTLQRLEEHNSTILSDALDSLGARRGTADQTREFATRHSQGALRDLDLRNAPPIDISRQIDRLGEVTLRNGYDSSEVATAQHIRGRLMEASDEVTRTGPNGETIRTGQYTINPHNAYQARKEFGAKPKTASAQVSTNKGTNVTENWNQHFATERQRELDQLIGRSAGFEYNDYLDANSAIRRQREQQGFMQDFAASTSKGTHDTGARIVNKGEWRNRMADRNENRPIPGSSNRTMSLRRMEEIANQPVNTLLPNDTQFGPADPGPRARLGFMQRADADLNDAAYTSRPGTGSVGSNTDLKKDLGRMIEERTVENMGLIDRTMYRAGRLANIGTYAATHATNAMTGSPVAGAATNAMTRGVGQGITGFVQGGRQEAVRGVERVLGQAYTDPAELARLMRLDPLQRRSIGAGARSALPYAGAYGAMGGLAGERSSRYR